MDRLEGVGFWSHLDDHVARLVHRHLGGSFQHRAEANLALQRPMYSNVGEN